jgi:hypothetical protein
VSRRALAVALGLLGAAAVGLLLLQRLFDPFASDADVVRNIQAIEAFNSTGHEKGWGVIARGDELLVLAETNSRGRGGYDLWLLRLDGEGNLRGSSTHGGPRNDEGTALAAQPPDRFVTVGSTVLQDGFAGQVRGFGPRARELWSREVGQGQRAGFETVAVSAAGTVVAGGRRGEAGWLVGLGPDGTPGWERLLPGVLESVTAVAFTRPSGRLAAVGLSENPLTGLGRSALVRLDASGAPLGEKRDPGDRQAEVYGLAALPDEGLVLVGKARVAPEDALRGWVVRLDARDEVVWEQVLDADAAGQGARAVVAHPDGGLTVVGTSLDMQARTHVGVMRLAADGRQVWRTLLPGEAYGYVAGLARLEDGGVVLVGALQVAGRMDVWVLRVSADGQLLWSRTYGGDTQ